MGRVSPLSILKMGYSPAMRQVIAAVDMLSLQEHAINEKQFSIILLNSFDKGLSNPWYLIFGRLFKSKKYY